MKNRKEENSRYYLKHREEILDKKYGKDRKRYIKRNGHYPRSNSHNTPQGRAAALHRLYRFLENHPEISENYLEFVERMIRVNERTKSLDMERGQSNFRLYECLESQS